MKLLIVEDEHLLALQLSRLVKEIKPGCTIIGQTNSIDTTLQWLQTNDAPDLVFMDIELADGQCFEIFNHYPLKAPVIFTTAYDEYALQAFKVNSIDYLLKPIQEKDLRAALDKWNEIHYATDWQAIALDNMLKDLAKQGLNNNYKDRFLVKQGQKMLSVATEEVACFNARNTLNFIITKEKQKFIVDYTLDQVEELVPSKKFFRVNRQFIISHDIITSVHPWFNGKLKVETRLPIEDEIVVSREKAPHFKMWMGA